MKNLLLIPVLVLSGFLLTSCGEDEDDNPQPKAVDTEATITGKWLVTRMEQRIFDETNTQSGPTKIETIYPYQAITFTSPNSFLEEQTGSNPKQAAGTFVHNGNTLSLNIPAMLYINGGDYQVDTLNANRLVMQITVPATGTSPKYNRVIRASR